MLVHKCGVSKTDIYLSISVVLVKLIMCLPGFCKTLYSPICLSRRMVFEKTPICLSTGVAFVKLSIYLSISELFVKPNICLSIRDLFVKPCGPTIFRSIRVEIITSGIFSNEQRLATISLMAQVC